MSLKCRAVATSPPGASTDGTVLVRCLGEIEPQSGKIIFDVS